MAAILNYLRLEFRTVPAPGPLGLNFICHDNLESMSESMHSIVFDWQNRLKMPRPDAYVQNDIQASLSAAIVAVNLL